MGGEGGKRRRRELTGSSRFKGVTPNQASSAPTSAGGPADRDHKRVRVDSDEEEVRGGDDLNNDLELVGSKTIAETNEMQEGETLQVSSEPEMGQVIKPGERRVIIILEEACLEAVKSRSGQFELLNCDDHLGMHKRLNRDPQKSRPDIAHQCLLTLLDSPINKAGLLTVYVRTAQGILIEVSPHLRIPRTFKRFAGLMVQLLHKMRIRADQGSKTLLRIVKNPPTLYFPTGARKFATSVTGTLVDVHEFVKHLPDEPVVFAFGAMAVGHIAPDYVENFLSFSQYPMSGSYAIGRLLGAFEHKWGIV